MPNWIEGTMKLRGKRENIRRFFLEGLDPSSWLTHPKILSGGTGSELMADAWRHKAPGRR